MLMVVPDHGFKMPRIDVHPLVDLLGEVDQLRHKSHPFLRSMCRSGTSLELCVVVPMSCGSCGSSGASPAARSRVPLARPMDRGIVYSPPSRTSPRSRQRLHEVVTFRGRVF